MNIFKVKVAEKLPNYRKSQKTVGCIGNILVAAVAVFFFFWNYFTRFMIKANDSGVAALYQLDSDGTYDVVGRGDVACLVVMLIFVVGAIMCLIALAAMFVFIVVFKILDVVLKEPRFFSEIVDKEMFADQYLIVDRFALPFARKEEGKYYLYYCLNREEILKLSQTKDKPWKPRKMVSAITTSYFATKNIYVSGKHFEAISKQTVGLAALQGMNYVMLRVPLDEKEVRCRALYSEREINYLLSQMAAYHKPHIDVVVGFGAGKTIALTEAKLHEMQQYLIGKDGFYLYLPMAEKKTPRQSTLQNLA